MMGCIAIVGIGLIGGSLGIDIRRLKLAREVIGIVRRRESIEKAIKSGAVDRATIDITGGSKDADMVILATPISTMLEIAGKLCIKKESVVIDVASVKGRLVSRLEEVLGKNYVGTHPMAGSEKKGISAARAGLFNGAVCIITPTENTRPRLLKTVREFWNNLGARIVILSPGEHDRVVGLTSHLPHLVASSLINAISLEPRCIDCIGPGFKDATRIASSPPELWQEICEWNKEEILSGIDRFQKELSDLKTKIESNDWNNVLDKLKKAQDIRDGIY